MGWLTEHGQALVYWFYGIPFDAWDARFGNLRIDVQRTLDLGFRRKAKGDRRWIYGTLAIDPSDVTFTDGKQPRHVYPPPKDGPDLPRDLAFDKAFQTDLRDDMFASALYTSLAKQGFVNITTGQWQDFGERHAAEITAAVRNCGESYGDYFLCLIDGALPGPRADQITFLRSINASEETIRHWYANADLFDRLDAHLNRLGWRVDSESDRRKQRDVTSLRTIAKRVDSESDRRKQRHVTCLRAIAKRVAILPPIRTLEAMPAKAMPDWAASLNRSVFTPYLYPQGDRIWNATAEFAAIRDFGTPQTWPQAARSIVE